LFRPQKQTRKQFINSSHVGNYVDIGEGMRMHYLDEGSGEVILLIHGLGQSLYTWRNNFHELAKRYRVVAVDLLGFGYSDHVDIDYTVDEITEALRLFMEGLGISRAHVVAFSTGCIYALNLAGKYPPNVDRLILLSPGGLPEKTATFWMNMVVSGTFTTTALALFSVKKMVNVLMDVFFDKTCITPDVISNYYEPLASKEARRCLARAIINFDTEPVMERLRDINNHTLILGAGDDTWHPAEDMKFFAMPIANSYDNIIRNCGHMMHEEKADKVNATIIEFLEWNGRI
jgi:pimeloyl-ACP methyl ester carboxylesterase